MGFTKAEKHRIGLLLLFFAAMFLDYALRNMGMIDRTVFWILAIAVIVVFDIGVFILSRRGPIEKP